MGKGRWAKVLRFLVCFIASIVLAVLLAQKAS